MGLRYRTRLSIAIGLLIAVAISATSLLILLSTMMGLAETYHRSGVTLTRIATREISVGLLVQEEIMKLLDEQMSVSALLSAELVYVAEQGARMSPAEIDSRFESVVKRSQDRSGAAFIDEFTVSDENGTIYIGTHDGASQLDIAPVVDPEQPGVPALEQATDVAGQVVPESHPPTAESVKIPLKYVTVPGVDNKGEVRIGMNEERIEGLKRHVRMQNVLDRFVSDSGVKRVVIVGLDGSIIAARNSAGAMGAAVVDSRLLTFCREFLQDPPEQLYQVEDFDGDVGVVTCLMDSQRQMTGALFIQHDTGQAVHLARVIMIQIIIVGVIITLISIWISNYLSRDFSKPIDLIVKGAKEFGRGRLDHRLEPPSQEEFKNVADAFNSMAASLQEHMARLEEETRFRERLQSELSIASELQRSLLPTYPPEDPGIQVAGWSVAAKEVGGDFYDYTEIAENRLGIAIGDATGKGLPAALLVTECWSVLRALSADTHSVSELLYRTNNALVKRLGRSGKFITLFCMVVDTERGVLRYSSAGHNPPILVGADTSRIRLLESRTGLPLGIKANCRYGEHEIALEPGDTILMYSDGLTDAHNPQNAMYGPDRMQDIITSLRGRPIEEIVAGLRIDVESYMQGREMFDDMTVLGVRFVGVREAAA